ncbi:MAG: hypothetical protein AVDCRST_MAG29-508 [uncultured Nocardioidaceae bacterium]|uniref:Uncharacterized protein n=1 Tax=uncultured Nocardioidaceae bacterium TaxID=253824 RepID=A0A6J4L4C8_9ACTN|nr:MAG: hypothetical protein AVDCRST_MAG29-508 [uncultured Nocardioidaceae bacterium]
MTAAPTGRSGADRRALPVLSWSAGISVDGDAAPPAGSTA